MGYPFNLFYLSCCASSTTLWCFRFDSTNSNSSIFFAKHCPKITEVKKLPVKFFLLSHQGTRWPWGMFVQRFRANASCVFQGKIQGGLFHFLTKQEAFIEMNGTIALHTLWNALQIKNKGNTGWLRGDSQKYLGFFTPRKGAGN